MQCQQTESRGCPDVNFATAPKVTLLDGFGVQLNGRASEPSLGELPHGVQRLVAHICLTGRPVRPAIAGHLWPEVPEELAHGRLRSTLWRAKKAAPGLIEVSGDAISLAADVRVDVREFSDWARRALDRRTGVEEMAVPDVWLRGELLPGWYDEWVLPERERLRQLRAYTLEALAGKLAAVGRCGEALQAAYGAVRAEPLRESAYRVVMRVHVTEGNAAEALRTYLAFREILEVELGVAPSEQMAQLVQEIQRRHCGVAG